MRLRHTFVSLRRTIGEFFAGSYVLALLPAMLLAGFWLGGEPALLAVAIGFPASIAIARLAHFEPPRLPAWLGFFPAVQEKLTLVDEIETNLRTTGKSGRAACVVIELDNIEAIAAHYGEPAAEFVQQRAQDRITSALRRQDRLHRHGGNRFGIAVQPMPGLTAKAAILLANRLQKAISDPLSLNETTIILTASIGLSLEDVPTDKGAAAMIEDATKALEQALYRAPGAVQVYCDGTKTDDLPAAARIRGDVFRALENGQIHAHFQPQICTDTGHVSGFEALARWHHPQRGVVAPGVFLPLFEAAGAIGLLGEVILRDALSAFRSWQAAGMDIGGIGVNFAPCELRNPRLSEKIAWELDRCEVKPANLCIEILETVVAVSPDDMIARNITALSEMGCRIDLDDFGTGHASISSIRRFSVHRLKIDRSFISGIDRDAQQQRMVAAILTMAEQLGLETLAEGVESAGEHAMLAQLGCGHVQGFGIAHPMPFSQTVEWYQTHTDKIRIPPTVRSRTG